MPKLTIDHREVEVPPGATVLAAAQKLGIDIPTLCYRDGCAPQTSCLVCMVKLLDTGRLTPSCGTLAVDGMRIESETEEVHKVRRAALELLLSDHLGDCLAPCYFGCPAQMDIPTMLRQIVAGDLRGAIATVKHDIALPAVLGRICPAPCENVCRRSGADGAVAICLLKRYVADADLAGGDPYRPACAPPSGRRVAIVGGGATGLAAAYFLACQGHACTIFDDQAELGGRLLRETTPAELPRDVLAAEITTITRLGVEVRANVCVGESLALAELRGQFDAVLIAAGSAARDLASSSRLAVTPRGIHVKAETFETDQPGIFAAGNAIRNKGLAVRSAADGKEAAMAIGQFLAGAPVTGPHTPLSTRIGKMEAAEVQIMLTGAGTAPAAEPQAGLAAGYSDAEAVAQSARCLHCDCRGLHTCRLRKYAEQYGAQPRRYKGQRRTFAQDAQHADVVFEPGKCIDCGLCIQIAAAAREPLGLTFIGRGFDVRVAAPLGRAIDAALQRVAAECVAACPTAALAWKQPAGAPRDH